MLTIGSDAAGWKSGLLDVSAIIILAAAGFFAAMLLLRHAQAQPGTGGRHWKFYAAGCLIYAIVQLSWEPFSPSVADIGLVFQYLCYLTALRFHFRAAGSGYPLLRFYLDVLAFTAAAAGLYWHYVHQPEWPGLSSGSGTLLIDFALLATSGCMVVGLLALMLFNRCGDKLRSMALLLLAFAAMTAGRHFALEQLMHSAAAPVQLLPEACTLLGLLLMAGAAVAGKREPEHRREEWLLQPDARPLQMLVPAIAVCALYGALLAGIEQWTPLYIGLLLTILFLLLRLLLGMFGFISTEKALLEAEGKYRNLVENSQVGVFVERRGRLTYVNRYFADTFQFTPAELVGRALADLLPADDVRKLNVAYTNLATRLAAAHVEVRGLQNGGEEVYVEIQMTRTIDGGAPAITGTLLNITERKLAEELLIRSEKLSVIGQLAAGVAHEIRNPLTALKGFTQLLQRKTQHDREYFEIMLTELDRINFIVNEFMLLSKPHHVQQLGDYNLKFILGEVLPIIDAQSILNNVVIEVEWESDIPNVRCDNNQIKQVLVNLLKNAIEAMVSGGNVFIRFYEQDDYTCMNISDTGPGMPQEHLARLGEPFFSTKSTGTGLGLMVCYRIIEAHRGKMHIDSVLQQGTTVEIALPNAVGQAGGNSGITSR